MRRWVSLLLVVSIWCVAASAFAQQGMQLNRYSAANAPEDMFAAESPVARGHDYWAGNLVIDYANSPLVFEETATGERTPIVENQLTLRAMLSYSLFDRLLLYGGLPIHLAMSGEDVLGRPETDESTLSDPWLGARLRLYGEPIDPFAVGLSVDVTFPLGQAIISDQAYSGEQTATFVPKLLIELRPWLFRVTANLGVRLREEYTSSSGALVRNELLWRAGVGLDIFDQDEHHLEAIVEAYGNHDIDFFARSETTNVELLFGLKYLSDGGLTAGLAAGPGLSQGWGTPAARMIFSLGYIQPEPEPEPIDEEPADTDGDGFNDDDDMCIEEPEDVDEFEDEDGCPDRDDDRDGIEDVDDGCRLEAEDLDGFEDDDGCPDPDNDGDGIEDTPDQCADEAEDIDGFEDEDGCPDLDNDQDGVPDADDQCPLAPGTAEANGCPQAVRIENNQIRILQTIEFETNRAALLPTAEPILEEVRAVLAVNPQIVRIRVEGHTDDRGPDARNLRLSRQRAETVRTWLMEHGLSSERFEAWGCGESRPTAEGRTREARQANRRVEFHIVDPAPEAGAQSTEGCEMAEAPEAQAEAAQPDVPADTPAAAPADAPAE